MPARIGGLATKNRRASRCQQVRYVKALTTRWVAPAYVELRMMRRAMSAGWGGGWAGYPNSARTAAIAASATAIGLNSTVVNGGELNAAIGVASTPITARSPGQRNPASRIP